jgi:hypothetical protein
MIYHLKKFGTSLHWTKDYEEVQEAYKKTSLYGVELWAIDGASVKLLAKK